MTMQPHATTTGTALPDLDQLKGMNVYDLNDEKIGSVEGVYVDGDQIYGHYGRTGYWEAVHARQTTPAPTPEIARAEAADDLARGRDGRRLNEPDDRLTVAERQSTPAPTPEIAEAAIADEMARGAVESDRTVAGDSRLETADRNITDRDAQYDRPGVRRYEW